MLPLRAVDLVVVAPVVGRPAADRQEDRQEDVVRLVELDVLLEPEEVEEFGTLIVLVD